MEKRRTIKRKILLTFLLIFNVCLLADLRSQLKNNILKKISVPLILLMHWKYESNE